MQKKFYPPQRKRFGQIALKEQTKQILLGGILGDGSLKIAKRYKNARYSERHSWKQEAYLRWKVDQLSPEIKGCISINAKDKGSYSLDSKLIYQSHVSPALTALHLLTHDKNQKKIRRRWLNNVDALALAVWWCDDGCLNICTQQGELCTDGFNYLEQKRLQRYLQVDWNIGMVLFSRQGKYRLRFANRSQFEDWLTLILPFIPVACMLPKVMLCYDNVPDQKRWISKVKKACPHLTRDIEKLYELPLEREGHKVNATFSCRHLFYPLPKDRWHQ